MEHGHGPVGPAGSVHELLVALPELFHFPLAVGIGLGHTDAGDAALHGGVDCGVAFAAVIEGPAHGPAEIERHHHQNGHTGEDDQGQYRVDHDQVAKGQNDHHRADQQILGAVVGQLADLEQVAGDAGHDAAGLMVVVEPEGLLLQVGEQILTHLGLHLHAYHMAVVLHEIPHQHAQYVQSQHDQSGCDDGGVHFLRDIDIEHFVGHDGVYHADD